MSQTDAIYVHRTIINGAEYLHDRNTNTLYMEATSLPVGVWNPSTNTIDPYEEEDDDDEDNEQNLEEIMGSIDRIKLYLKASINACQNRQSSSFAKEQFEFYVEEEKRNKKCELLVDLNKRYILETNAEKKNILKQLINTTSEKIKNELLEMIEDTDCQEGLYLIYCKLAKEKYTIIDNLMQMNKLADEITAL
jgi:hypothetical protein